ncbi:SDR family NAD(P)-dependent oxidoreductase [Nocardia jiangxiensis]|uniref:SDR family NAD(P)-dependent oxidoreductase n=1 Tax=Nocardia jiangxiensis TaxID=282685 RepID=A0ABW6RX77_9NOCA|nr:glucose 1-dehydrogenase [Nocardia jiangxiensis]
MDRFTGKTVLVTGAGGGIGRACATLLATQGARVAVADIADEPARATAELITAAGGLAHAYTMDVTSSQQVHDTVAVAQDDLGPITLAVSAAGIIRDQPFLELSEEGWDTTMSVNLKGTFLLFQTVARHAQRHGGGAMVAIASVAGRSGRPTAADYAASKAGVISLVRSAALALAPSQITVNAVCPGVVDTEMTRAIHQRRARINHITAEESFAQQAAQIPLGRIVSPTEIAEAAAFLLSPTASTITGQALNVCGGLEMN